jgi:Kef-type K+ transport system membrane component KefB
VGAQGVATVADRTDALMHMLVALTAVIVAGWLLNLVLRAVRQPPVIGEVVGGILLGPSFLGWVWPDAAAFVLPPSVAPYLGTLAQFGVILYMFLVGLELNLDLLRRRAGATLLISQASIAVPFLLGAILAVILYPRLSDQHVPFTTFALFMGVAISITAFPVLARILTDRQMQHTRPGIMVLVCAAMADVTAWCLLAFVVGVAQARVGSALLVIGLAMAYIALMFPPCSPCSS